ncbi:acyltransferase [Pseudopedobacter beijingensis]|uniref:Acyltransferase n=1 Tax=Pseudopedobacter beijingensis TaxID=1207056 RepID=A0ABW4I8F8_9SPHI
MNFLKVTVKKFLKRLYFALLKSNSLTRIVYETRETQTPVSVWQIVKYKIFRKGIYWPVHPSSKVANFRNVVIGIETSPGLMPGCYIQGNGKVYIGDYTQIGPGVGIISSNHDIYDNRIGVYTTVDIGKYCWIGMNAVILPNVTLGEYTIVGAGSVVTKSFPEGYVVVGGNPAKVIKKLDPSKCIKHVSEFEYNGFIKHSKFEKFRRLKLNV